MTPHGQSMGALRGMGGQRPIVVQLMLPGGRMLEQILIEYSKTTGRPLQVRTLGRVV